MVNFLITFPNFHRNERNKKIQKNIVVLGILLLIAIVDVRAEWLFNIKFTSTSPGMGIRTWSGDLANPCPASGTNCALVITPVWCEGVVRPTADGGVTISGKLESADFVSSTGERIQQRSPAGLTFKPGEYALEIVSTCPGKEMYQGLRVDLAGVSIREDGMFTVHVPPMR